MCVSCVVRESMCVCVMRCVSVWASSRLNLLLVVSMVLSAAVCLCVSQYGIMSVPLCIGLSSCVSVCPSVLPSLAVSLFVSL